MTFVLPTYPTTGLWGPALPEESSIGSSGPRVYAKNDRIGKLADWQLVDEEDRKKATKSKSGFKEVKNVGEMKELKREAKQKMVTSGGRGAGPWTNRGRAGATGRGGPGRGRGGYAPKEQVFVAPTLKIPEDIRVVPIEFNAHIRNAASVTVLAHADIAVQGFCQAYDDKIDQASALRPVRLPPAEAPRELSSAFLDPVVRAYIQRNAGKRIIFGSDVALAKLMTSTTAVNSFDLQIMTNRDFVAIGERVGKAGGLAVNDNRVDYEWVNETAPFNVPSEDVSANTPNINSSVLLAQENARASRSFRQAAKQRAVIRPPGGEKSELKTNTIFRYRKWTLNAGTDEEVEVVIRCEVDAGKATGGTTTFMKLFAMLEGPPHDDVIPWKAQSDKAGSLLVKAMNNNKGKVANWAALSLLAGVDQMKIALVTRTTLSSNESHEIIGVATCPTREFAGQMGIDLVKLFTTLNAVAGFTSRFTGEKKDNVPVMLALMKEPKNDRLLLMRPDESTRAADESESSSDSDSDSDDSDSSNSSDSESD